MPTRVVILEPVWKRICRETHYWAERGIACGQGPMESVFYPLVHIELKRARTLFDRCDLEDVERIVVCDVFIPPRRFTSYTPYSASFRDDDAKELYWTFNRGVARINARHPRLLFIGPGHSHPFAQDYTSPSGTDLRHHILPYLRKNSELLDLRLSLAIILARSDDGWVACCFAADAYGVVRDLGRAVIVPRGHHRDCFRLPYYRKARGLRWESSIRAKLAERLVELERWPGGWTSLIYRASAEESVLLVLPPSFPKSAPVARLLTEQGHSPCGEIDLGERFRDYSLKRIEERVYERCLFENTARSR